MNPSDAPCFQCHTNDERIQQVLARFASRSLPPSWPDTAVGSGAHYAANRPAMDSMVSRTFPAPKSGVLVQALPTPPLVGTYNRGVDRTHPKERTRHRDHVGDSRDATLRSEILIKAFAVLASIASIAHMRLEQKRVLHSVSLVYSLGTFASLASVQELVQYPARS
jgi:hypothetical protein